MNKSFFIVLALVLLLICSIAEGADWKLYGRTADGCSYYYDVSRVKTLSKGIKKVWTKTQADNNKCILALIKMRTEYGHSIKGYENYNRTIELVEIDCSSKVTGIETSTDYDNKGNVLDKVISWDATVPETFAYGLYERICK